MQFRRCELLLIAFYAYAAAVSFAIPPTLVPHVVLVSLNLALIGWFCLFAFAHKGRGFHTLDYVRDWYPVPLILLAFREMGWLAQVDKTRSFENYWIVWDRWLIHDLGFRAAVEWAGPLFPNLLELSYLLVYGVPVFVVAMSSPEPTIDPARITPGPS